jgi:hypothetical protein
MNFPLLGFDNAAIICKKGMNWGEEKKKENKKPGKIIRRSGKSGFGIFHFLIWLNKLKLRGGTNKLFACFRHP